MSSSSRRRVLYGFRGLLVALVLVLTGAMLTACSAPNPVSTAEGSSVGSAGFSLRVKGATATAGAAVAPKGTSVALADVGHKFPSRYSKDMAGLGSPIRLSLAKNRQPSAPITLRFKIDQSKVSKATWSSPKTFFVATQSAGSSTTILMPATYDSNTGELVVTTYHLSWFWPIQFNLGAFLGGIANTLLEGLGVQFPEPDCSDNTEQVSYRGASYHVTGAWAVTPCLSSDSDSLNLDLYSTTGIPFKVVSSPNGSATALPGLAASGVVSTAVFGTLFGEKGAKLLAPGGRLKYSYTGAAPRTLSFEEAPATLLVVILVNVAEAALPEASGAAQALSAMGKLDCMSQVADTAEAASSKLSTEAAGRIVSAFISCAGQMMGGNLIWTLATAVPSLLINDALGVITSLAGQGSFSLNVSSTPDPTSPNGATPATAGPPVAGSGPSQQAAPSDERLGATGTLAGLIPSSPTGLIYDATGSLALNTQYFLELGREDWGGVVGCDVGFLPETSDALAAEFTDLDTKRHGQATAYLFRLPNAASAKSELATCNANGNEGAPKAVTVAGQQTFTKTTWTGRTSVSIVGNVLILVDGSEFGTDRSTALFQQIVTAARQ